MQISTAQEVNLTPYRAKIAQKATRKKQKRAKDDCRKEAIYALFCSVQAHLFKRYAVF